MKVPFINASQQEKISRSLKRNAVEKTIKSIAREKQIMYENMLRNRLKNQEPQPLHIIPELNFLGLWKWF